MKKIKDNVIGPKPPSSLPEAADSQQAAIAFLSRPDSYDPAPEGVERIETHSAYVFLAGAHAYKIKRAVKYPFLDFSTLEKRRLACLNELKVNRRTAPEIYLDVTPIARGPDGALRWGGGGDAVEWVVRMRRFDQGALLDRMAEEGRLEVAQMGPLADAIHAFHTYAERRLDAEGSVAGLAGVIGGNHVSMSEQPDVFERGAAEAFTRACRRRLEALAPLLRRRALLGFVRHCHGDLHLRNIVLLDGRPVLFDALEFDDALATIDTLYDLAFLMMDLWFRGLTAHANAVLNQYLSRGGTANLHGLAALPLFLALRAMIRAKAEALRARHTEGGKQATAAADAARRYFALAQRLIAPCEPRFVAVGGLSGTGKTTLARALAPWLSPAPGAVHLRSDVERKRLFGKGDFERLPEAAYAPAVTETIYAVLRKKAGAVAQAGHSVIVDAVHGLAAEREAVEAVARERGRHCAGLWLTADEDALFARVRERRQDASDADEAVVRRQLGYDVGQVDWERIATDRPFEAVLADAARAVGLKRA